MSNIRPHLGVIEGFYGQPWPAATRHALCEWLPPLGIDYYLYAPKADRALRREWQAPWPHAEYADLCRLTRAGATAGLCIGVGLSPFAVYACYRGAERRALRDRVTAIVDSGAAFLAVLFDDMPGDVDALVARQLDVVGDIAHWVGGLQLFVCPTYYSDDPVLDRLFGERPSGYLADFGAGLPEGTALFWTGPQVCSAALRVADLPRPAERGGAPLALWDNYPVNDSRERSSHLYVAPPSDREPGLASAVTWHWSNGMNQAALTLPALAGLAALYGAGSADADSVLRTAGVDRELREACAPLARRTVDELTETELGRLQRCAEADTLAARELAGFLRGDYIFDPECLTD